MKRHNVVAAIQALRTRMSREFWYERAKMSCLRASSKMRDERYSAPSRRRYCTRTKTQQTPSVQQRTSQRRRARGTLLRAKVNHADAPLCASRDMRVHNDIRYADEEYTRAAICRAPRATSAAATRSRRGTHSAARVTRQDGEEKPRYNSVGVRDEASRRAVVAQR